MTTRTMRAFHNSPLDRYSRLINHVRFRVHGSARENRTDPPKTTRATACLDLFVPESARNSEPLRSALRSGGVWTLGTKMLGDYLTALLIAVLGYIYPVYLCFKVCAWTVPREPTRGRRDPLNRCFRTQLRSSVAAALNRAWRD